MKKKIVLILGLMAVANVCAAEIKIGVINIPKLMEKAPLMESAKKRLEKEFAPRGKALETQGKELQALNDKLERDAAVMSDTQRRDLEKDLMAKQREFKRAQQELSEDVNLKRNEELGKLNRRILESAREVAKADGFDLLLADGVIYSADQLDVTEQVMKKLNASGE